jgi:hypothetical protein
MAHTYRDTPSASSKIEIMIGATFTEILGASEITWDGFKRATRSPNYLSRTSMPQKPGQPSFGSVKCKVFYDPNDAVHKALRDRITATAAYSNSHPDQIRITYADGYTTPSTATLQGFVADFSQESGEVETGSWTANFEFPVDLVISFVDGSPAE